MIRRWTNDFAKMLRHNNTWILFIIFYLLLDIQEVVVIRVYSSTERPSSRIEWNIRTLPRQNDLEALKQIPANTFGLRTTKNSQSQCTTSDCNTDKKMDVKSESSKSKSQIWRTSRSGRNLSPFYSRNSNATNRRYPSKKNIKYISDLSKKVNADKDFVSILKIPQNTGKVKKVTTRRSGQRRVRFRSSNTEEVPVAIEKSSSLDILGDGNFEILSGGMFSDDETNEIEEGRRMGRGYVGDVSMPRFTFNGRGYRYPSFYQGRQQMPMHPMYFPNAAF